MKVNLGEAPPMYCDGVQVGDVYPAKGGRGDTRFWLVLALTNSEKSAHLLGLNAAGEVVSTCTYGTFAMAERKRIGFCEEVRSFYPSIQWESKCNLASA